VPALVDAFAADLFSAGLFTSKGLRWIEVDEARVLGLYEAEPRFVVHVDDPPLLV
jgi:hypothetical protein